MSDDTPPAPSTGPAEASPTAPPVAREPARDETRPTALREPAHQVGRKAPWLWAVGAAMRVVFLLVVGVAVELFGWFDVPWWAWAAYVVVSLVYVPLMPWIRFRIHRWESTETAVYTQVGFLSRQRQVAPMSKVQTIDMDESPVARLFGLATVTVTTASAMGSLTITAIDRDVAERLVADLTQRTEAEADDAT